MSKTVRGLFIDQKSFEIIHKSLSELRDNKNLSESERDDRVRWALLRLQHGIDGWKAEEKITTFTPIQ